MRTITCLLVLVGSLSWAADAKPLDVPQHLQEISVTIKAGDSQGSGVLVTRGRTTYVWTAAHVVSDLRHVRKPAGADKAVVEFDDPLVVQVVVEEGRAVGRIEMAAVIVKYSDADHGEDLALLRLRKKGFATAGAHFNLDAKPPSLGTEVYHCGSFGGEAGSNSLSSGIQSQYGRLRDGKVFDQISAPCYAGSSGGGAFLKSDGRVIGLVLRGAPGGMTLIVPSRRIVDYAKRAKIEWAVNEAVAMPADEALAKLAVESP